MYKLTKTQRKLSKRIAKEHRGKDPKHPSAVKDRIQNRGYAKIMGLILFHMVTPEKHTPSLMLQAYR